MNGWLCGKPEVGQIPGNGRMPPDRGRLVAENINNNLMAEVLR
jgi:hypothetical protein